MMSYGPWEIKSKIQPVGLVQVDQAEGLTDIHRSGCAAALWTRQPMASFERWITGLDPSVLPKARLILRPAAVQDAVRQICELRGTPEGSNRERLIDDIAALADIFGAIMQADWLRLRLDIVTTNACRKFHIDAVSARLVCTYRGTGTQYGTRNSSSDPQDIFTVPTGSPIILRGTKWPESPPAALAHRSPPIEGKDETRLLLVLDPVTDPAKDN